MPRRPVSLKLVYISLIPFILRFPIILATTTLILNIVDKKDLRIISELLLKE